MNIIKCTHHHFLKWAPTRAPKLLLVGVGVMWDSSSTNSGFADDILVLWFILGIRDWKMVLDQRYTYRVEQTPRKKRRASKPERKWE